MSMKFTILVIFVCCSEPLCTIGLGVCGLFSTLDTSSQSWSFASYSLTGVRALAVVGVGVRGGREGVNGLLYKAILQLGMVVVVA